jgi:hypothetical protein
MTYSLINAKSSTTARASYGSLKFRGLICQKIKKSKKTLKIIIKTGRLSYNLGLGDL